MSYFADLRSASIPSKRERTRSEKYYNFRHVKPGQLDRPHYRVISTPRGNLRDEEALSEKTPIEIWNKQRMYTEAQQWPRPPRYHRAHIDKLHKCGMTPAYDRRRYNHRQLGRELRKADADRPLFNDLEGAMELFHNNFWWCSYCHHDEMSEDGDDEEWPAEVEIAVREHGKVAADWLVEEAVLLDGRRALGQLEEDVWSLCGSNDLMSEVEESDWDFEIL